MSFEVNFTTSLVQVVIRPYLELIEKIVEILFDLSGLKLQKRETLNFSKIDARISKIDDAKKNLNDVLTSLDDLSIEAEKAKSDLKFVRQELDKTKKVKG